MRSLRIEAAVKNVDWRLEGWVSRRKRREIRRELRANLSAAAEEVGPEEAVHRLGSLRELASAYLEAERRAVNPRLGLFAALATITVLFFVWAGLTQAFREGYEAGVGGSSSADLGPLSFVGKGAIGAASFTLEVPWYLFAVPVLVAFLVGSRAWALLRRR